MDNDPLVTFASFMIVPTDGTTGVSLTPILKFNCDLAGDLRRSDYEEGRYNMRFIVNTEVVYESPSGAGHFWNKSTGGSRQTYPQDDPRTPEHSESIKYTCTAGQGSLYYNDTFRVSVDLKYNIDSVWTEVIHADFTTMDHPTPKKAIDPSPADEAIDVDPTTEALTWTDGGSGGSAATSYDVYLDVYDLVGTVTDPTFDLVAFGGLDPGYTYYWRIDSSNINETVTGDTWSFTTASPLLPEKPINPSPTNGESDITFLWSTLSWSDGGSGESAATSYEARIGLVNDDSMTIVASGPATSVPMDTILLPDQTYYWRVDATNSHGTTTGDTWTFVVDDDPIRNKQESGVWLAGGQYTVEIYTPDTHVSVKLSLNDSLDATGDAPGAIILPQHKVEENWTEYLVKVPFDSEVGTFYLKWNYNDE